MWCRNFVLYTKVVTSFTVDLKRPTFILFKIEGVQLLYLKYLYTVILQWIMFRQYDLVFLRGKVLSLKKEGKILSTENLRKSGEGEIGVGGEKELLLSVFRIIRRYN